ncbi:hypothetical protein G4B88_028178 [Cannabis sativa]|uniref:Centromere protein Mis12 n=1 Tax=Cannabis sativa TaxID=3483 RepID=A0A7J6HUU4_CANSA|nr:hypothetical protein G4B88_028178 [Cannabis sativa]
MEDTRSDTVFDSLNLNPQLFINEAIFLDSRGVAVIHKMIISVLDKRLAMWEQYCLNHCFEVPEGFSLPKTIQHCGLRNSLAFQVGEPTSNNSICQDALSNPDLDARLDSLRNKLSLVGKESAALNRELRALEQQSVPSSHFAGLINEALHVYEENSFDGLFQEMAKTVSELKAKMAKLKTNRMEETERKKTERLFTLSRDASTFDHCSGFTGSKLEDLQDFLVQMKKM